MLSFNAFVDTYCNMLNKTLEYTLYPSRLRFVTIEKFKATNHDLSPGYKKSIFIKN